jgi:hypothetical protein
MKEGHFYFLKDDYYNDFKGEQSLAGNKGKGHDRPCFYAFKDNSTGLYWMVPISSQVSKYKSIYANKTKNGRKCDTIIFGEVLGKEKAFLIQNMCPVNSSYIKNEYLKDSSPVKVNKVLEHEIKTKAKKVLALVKKGYKNIIYTDILKIENELLCHTLT